MGVLRLVFVHHISLDGDSVYSRGLMTTGLLISAFCLDAIKSLKTTFFPCMFELVERLFHS